MFLSITHKGKWVGLGKRFFTFVQSIHVITGLPLNGCILTIVYLCQSYLIMWLYNPVDFILVNFSVVVVYRQSSSANEVQKSY